jgi:type I restriction enzyme M protein
MARGGTKSKNSQPLTTAQRLSSIVKACRDNMRKNKGLNGDLDRLPMLTWIMFLKFLDDMEQIREEEAKMSGKRFLPALDAPYRWRDWAAKPEGITGDELISFVNNEEAVRPDRTKGPGCSPIFAVCKAPTVATGGMSSPRSSKAPSTG